jgi:hypothetical protein
MSAQALETVLPPVPEVSRVADYGADAEAAWGWR